MQRRLDADQRAVDPRDLAHQLVASEHYFDVFGMCRMHQRLGESFLQALPFLIGAMRSEKIGAQHQEQGKYEYEKRYDHFYISSKKTRGNCRPDCFNRSANRGRIPVGRKRPSTWPCASTPVLSYWKISCIVIVSPSMPVISEMDVTRREPSDMRATCTTRLSADATCWRMARSDRCIPVIWIMVSR